MLERQQGTRQRVAEQHSLQGEVMVEGEKEEEEEEEEGEMEKGHRKFITVLFTSLSGAFFCFTYGVFGLSISISKSS